MTFDRRQFLKASCAAAAALAVPRWAAAGTFDSPAAAQDRILVVINLEGGNDGLNTVIPVSDRRYAALRGRLGLARSQTIPIDAKTGFHPSLRYFAKMMNRGQLAVIEGVGYPQADLSHFRSNDIWSSGVAETYEPTGWLGRALDALYENDAAARSDSGHMPPMKPVAPLASTAGPQPCTNPPSALASPLSQALKK